jgi:hypothetical protein
VYENSDKFVLDRKSRFSHFEVCCSYTFIKKPERGVIIFETVELDQSSFFSGFSSLLFLATPKYESESVTFDKPTKLTHILVFNAGVFTVFETGKAYLSYGIVHIFRKKISLIFKFVTIATDFL